MPYRRHLPAALACLAALLATAPAARANDGATLAALWTTVDRGGKAESGSLRALTVVDAGLAKVLDLPAATFAVSSPAATRLANTTALAGLIAFRYDAKEANTLRGARAIIAPEVLALKVDALDPRRLNEVVTIKAEGPSGQEREVRLRTDAMRLPRAAETFLLVHSIDDPQHGGPRLVAIALVPAATGEALFDARTFGEGVTITPRFGARIAGFGAAGLVGRRELAVPPEATVGKGGDTIIVNDNDWPPFFFAGKPKSPPGLAKEILTRCLPKTGRKTVFKNFPIKRMRRDMESGELDINVYSYEKSREAWLIFGKEPIFAAEYRPVVREGSKIVIKKLEDFDNLRLGHLAGLVYSPEFLAYIEKRQKAGTLDVADQEIINLKKLLAGRLDVFVNSAPTVRWLAHENDAGDKIKVLDYVIKRGDYFVAFSKASSRLTEAEKRAFLSDVDACLKAAKLDGTYHKIMTSYGQL